MLKINAENGQEGALSEDVLAKLRYLELPADKQLAEPVVKAMKMLNIQPGDPHHEADFSDSDFLLQMAQQQKYIDSTIDSMGVDLTDLYRREVQSITESVDSWDGMAYKAIKMLGTEPFDAMSENEDPFAEFEIHTAGMFREIAIKAKCLLHVIKRRKQTLHRSQVPHHARANHISMTPSNI